MGKQMHEPVPHCLQCTGLVTEGVKIGDPNSVAFRGSTMHAPGRESMRDP